MSESPEKAKGPERFEAFAAEFHAAAARYQEVGFQYYNALRFGIEWEDVKAEKDLARIELETIGAEILEAVDAEKKEIEARFAAMEGPASVIGPMSLTDLIYQVNQQNVLYASDQRRYTKLLNLEAFLHEHGVHRTPED